MSDLIRYGVTRRWSDAVVAGQVAYFVEVPDDASLAVRDQFIQVFQQVHARLEMVGSDRTRLIQVLVYLTDLADLDLFNSLWDEWIPEGHAPSRACTVTQLVAPGYRVELVVTAAVR